MVAGLLLGQGGYFSDQKCELVFNHPEEFLVGYGVSYFKFFHQLVKNASLWQIQSHMYTCWLHSQGLSFSSSNYRPKHTMDSAHFQQTI